MLVKVIIVFKSTQNLESIQIILDTFSLQADSLPWQVEYDCLDLAHVTVVCSYRHYIITSLLTVVSPCHFISTCLASHSSYRTWKVLTLNSTILLCGLGKYIITKLNYSYVERCILASQIAIQLYRQLYSYIGSYQDCH